MTRKYFFCWYDTAPRPLPAVFVTENGEYIGSRMSIISQHEITEQEAFNKNIDALKLKYPLEQPSDSG